MGNARRNAARLLAGASLALLGAPAAAGAAEQLYGVTDEGNLVHFTSDAPGKVTRDLEISGLAAGERVVGIDVRPATDELMALGSSSRLYLLNPTTARARPVSPGPFTPPLVGSNFGFDFNPTTDRIRVVSDADQNLQLNPNNGQVAAVDGQIEYTTRPGDPGAGSDPGVTGSAYTNSVPGATSTTLFGIDTARDALVHQDPENAGTLNTVRPLGLDAPLPNGFDITAGNVGYAAFTGEGGSSLFRVNTTFGYDPTLTAATLAAGNRSSVGGNRSLVALAAAGSVPDDNTRPRVLLQAEPLQDDRRVLRRGLDAAASCSEACTLAAVVRRGSRRLGSTVGGLDEPGFDSVDVRLNRRGRALVRRGAVRLRLSVTATDAAGNRTTKRKTTTVR
jgi:hypothetical protein